MTSAFNVALPVKIDRITHTAQITLWGLIQIVSNRIPPWTERVFLRLDCPVTSIHPHVLSLIVPEYYLRQLLIVTQWQPLFFCRLHAVCQLSTVECRALRLAFYMGCLTSSSSVIRLCYHPCVQWGGGRRLRDMFKGTDEVVSFWASVIQWTVMGKFYIACVEVAPALRPFILSSPVRAHSLFSFSSISWFYLHLFFHINFRIWNSLLNSLT